MILINSRHAVQQALDWSRKWIKERAFAVENPGHEYTQRFGNREYQH
jgi:hypothetical protein